MTPKNTALAALVMFVMLSAACTREISFQEDVKPILSVCRSCHTMGAEGYKASGFSAETYESVMKGTKFGPIIEPGSSISSTLVILLEHKADPSINMPHGKRALPKKEIKAIKTWIDRGARNN